MFRFGWIWRAALPFFPSLTILASLCLGTKFAHFVKDVRPCCVLLVNSINVTMNKFLRLLKDIFHYCCFHTRVCFYLHSGTRTEKVESQCYQIWFLQKDYKNAWIWSFKIDQPVKTHQDSEKTTEREMKCFLMSFMARSLKLAFKYHISLIILKTSHFENPLFQKSDYLHIIKK